jgi:hypothetical protein
MSALDLMFSGDVSWQAARIANAIEALRNDREFQHAETMDALDRLRRLQAEQAAAAAQRVRLLQQAQDEEAKRRQLAGALVLHENELDRLLEATASVRAAQARLTGSESWYRSVIVERAIEVDAALKARMIGLALAISNLTISDFPSISDQRQFLAIQRKADTVWQQFTRRVGSEEAQQVELAALASLCEHQLEEHAYLACAYDHIVTDPNARQYFDGKHQAHGQATMKGSRSSLYGAVVVTMLGRVLGAVGGGLIGLYVAYELFRLGGGYIVLGIAAVVLLAPFCFGLGARVGTETLSHVFNGMFRRSRRARVDAVNAAARVGVMAAINATTARFTEALASRLTFADPTHTHHGQALADAAPNGFDTLGQRLADFWSRLSHASPVVRMFIPFDSERRVIYSRRAVDVLVAAVEARELLSKGAPRVPMGGIDRAPAR